MMSRRSFFAQGGVGMLASGTFAEAGLAASHEKKPYFEFRIFRLQMGSQVSRMNQWAEKHLQPLLDQHGFGPVGFFNERMGPHIPAFYVLLTYASLAERETLWRRVIEDPAWSGALDKLEAGSEPPYYRADGWLLQATDYSPQLRPTSGEGTQRIYELRIYESPTEKQLRALHERFAGPEIPIFHRSGVHPVLYADTVIGPNMPNLTYLTPFASLAGREKAWQAFGNDPEWPPALEASIRRSGEIVRNITSIVLGPTGFSALR